MESSSSVSELISVAESAAPSSYSDPSSIKAGGASYWVRAREQNNINKNSALLTMFAPFNSKTGMLKK
jgi:hypothetical protein